MRARDCKLCMNNRVHFCCVRTVHWSPNAIIFRMCYHRSLGEKAKLTITPGCMALPLAYAQCIHASMYECIHAYIHTCTYAFRLRLWRVRCGWRDPTQRAPRVRRWAVSWVRDDIWGSMLCRVLIRRLRDGTALWFAPWGWGCDSVCYMVYGTGASGVSAPF